MKTMALLQFLYLTEYQYDNTTSKDSVPHSVLLYWQYGIPNAHCNITNFNFKGTATSSNLMALKFRNGESNANLIFLIFHALPFDIKYKKIQ